MGSYRAVFCKTCNQPIPISATAANIQEEIAHGQSDRPGAFPARCRACTMENVYTMGDIRTLEGEPRKRAKMRAAGH